jgi:hypothetical protein
MWIVDLVKFSQIVVPVLWFGPWLAPIMVLDLWICSQGPGMPCIWQRSPMWIVDLAKFRLANAEVVCVQGFVVLTGEMGCGVLPGC